MDLIGLQRLSVFYQGIKLKIIYLAWLLWVTVAKQNMLPRHAATVVGSFRTFTQVINIHYLAYKALGKFGNRTLMPSQLQRN